MFQLPVVAGACLLLLVGGARFIWYVGKVGSPAIGVAKSWWYGAGGVDFTDGDPQPCKPFSGDETGRPREAAIEEDALQLELEEGK